MTTKNTASRKSGLHFEKVPLADVVKATAPGHFHGVQFYNDSDALSRIVCGFLGEGLEQGALALVIATPDHAARIESGLRSRGIDVDELKHHGCLVTLDAHETLELFMVDGVPHPGAFRRAVSAALTRLRRGREQCSVRAYGEMVDLLWKDDREAAAIRGETLWNQMGTTRDFKLLCAYSMGNFYKAAAIEDICEQHSHVIGRHGDATSLPVAQAESATAP